MAKQVKFVPKMANLSTGDGPVLYVWGDAGVLQSFAHAGVDRPIEIGYF